MKKFLSLLMATGIVFGSMTLIIAATPWDGTIGTTYAAGNGSEATPYLIATAEQLAYFADQINKGNDTDKYYKLDADIDLGGTYGTQTEGGIEYYVATNDKLWTSIGTTDKPFKGHFDGNNYKISNLVTAGGTNVGLFGVIEGATIQNVTISSGLITTAGKTATSNGTASNGGAIIANVVSTSTGNKVINCANYATVFVQSSAASIAGGIVGNIGSKAYGLTIENCINAGAVILHTGSNNGRAGGILGYAAGTDGTVSIQYCLNFGDVTLVASKNNNGSRVGGIAGGLNGKTVTVSNCFSSGVATVPSANTSATAGSLFGNTNAEQNFSNLYAVDTTKVAGNTTVSASPLISMKNGAAIRLVADSYGIRFISDISAGAIEMINAIKDENTEIKYGTIIMPTTALTGELTLEALASANKVQNTDYIVIEAKDGIKTDANGNATIYAAMVEETGKTYDATMKFSAVSYVEYTIDGVVYRTYTAYTAENNSRSMKDVATAALADETVIFSDAQKAILNGYKGFSMQNNVENFIPKYGNAIVKNVYDCGDNGWMIVLDSNESDYRAYLKKLEEQGYNKCAENQINNNLFATYKNHLHILNVSYYGSVGEARVFCDPVFTTALPVVTTDTSEPICETTMAQLQFVYDNDLDRGMCYVFRTSGGKFVIIDSGNQNTFLADELYRYLYENALDPNNIVVTAWLFTHGHGDHVGTFIEFAKKYSEKVTVEQFAFNRPSNAYHAVLDEGLWDEVYSVIDCYYASSDIVKVHPGQKFVIDNLTINVYFTIELYAPQTGRYNDSSIVMMVTVDDEKILLMGDSSNNVVDLIMSLYGESLKADFVQLAHHGYLGGGSDGELYALSDPTYVLMPGSMEVYEERKGRAYLKPLIESVPFERWFVADMQTYIFNFTREGVIFTTWF